MNYKEAGVDIAQADEFVTAIQQLTNDQPKRSELLPSNSGYGSCFSIPTGYKNPVIVSTTDGVGTKIKLALQSEDNYTALYNIGIDVVAMCVNDLLCEGAEPIQFLDYYATSELDLKLAMYLMSGIVEGCKQANCSLVGGETAVMPDMYASEEFDIAGFAVGIVEKDKRPNKNQVKPGDVVLGLPSNGVHSNGFSLIRKILEQSDVSLQDEFGDSTFGNELLKPTKIYVEEVLNAIKHCSGLIHGIAHITGGGFYGNIPRILPDNVRVVIHQDLWEWPEIFNWIKAEGEVSLRDMYETFNCGIGMVLIVDSTRLDRVLKYLPKAFSIGYVSENPNNTHNSLVIHNGKS